MRWIGLVLLLGVMVAAQAQSAPAYPRGELLYTTHCIACHTTQVHWREKKLATDWAGLVTQVERWQKNANLGWNGEDADAVARYLNAAYYHFPAPPGKPVAEWVHSLRIAHGE
jgi:mono/diheme cytochrome c family protein